MTTTIQLIDLYNPTTLELREAKKQELLTLAEEAKKVLEVEIIDNKTKDIVHAEQMKLRNARVEIEKARKDFTKNLDEQKAGAITIERELIGIISETEDLLKTKKEAYEAKIKAEKEAEEARKQQIIAERTTKLAKYGEVYDPIKHAPQILGDEDFVKILESLEIVYQEMERARKEKEEAERREREEFERQKREFEENEQIKNSLQNAQNITEIVNIFENLDEKKKEIFAKLFEERKEFLEFKAKKDEEERKIAEEKRKLEEEKARIEEEKRKAEQAKIDAENEKKRQEELAKAREEAAKKALEEQKIAEEKARLEAEAKAREEQEKLEKKKKYQAFLDSIGLTEENKNDFTFIDTPEGRKFYKFVGIYKK
ncbi:MAG: hypothetical protein ACTTH6_01765 [Candidatus Altimarinota bacterium]